MFANASRTFRAPAVALAATACLAACGGGGSSTAPVEPVGDPVAPSALKGQWGSSASTVPAQSLLVVPDGSTMTAWFVADDLQRQGKGRLSSGSSGASVSVQGRAYDLAAGTAPSALAYSGSPDLASASWSLSPGPLAFVRSATLDADSRLADVTGSWQARLTDGSSPTGWSIAADGRISGPGRAGCSHTGQLYERVGVQVFNASLVETCGGSSTSYSGIAAYRSTAGGAADRITLALTRYDPTETSALALSLSR